MLRIHSIESFGTHEGPGIRLVVFLQGCHLRCLYCHNPDTWDIKGGTEIEIETVLETLEKQKPYFLEKGGLTVSGGEPLIQRVALYKLFSEAKKRGFHTTLDTNGSILDDFTKKLLEVTDLVLLDIKHINNEHHKKLTTISNEIPLKFAEYCEEHNNKMWLRYVLVPGVTDQPQYLHEWGKHFTQYKNIERVEILPYHRLGEYKYEVLNIKYPLAGVKQPSLNEIKAAQKIFKEYFDTVQIR